MDKLGFSAPKVRSSIRLLRVILLRSDIRLLTSDIRCASFLANRISLKPQALISLSHKRQYHSAFAEYHYFYLTDKSKYEAHSFAKECALSKHINQGELPCLCRRRRRLYLRRV